MQKNIEEGQQPGLSRGKRKRLMKREKTMKKNHFQTYLHGLASQTIKEKEMILGDMTSLKDALDDALSVQPDKKKALRGKQLRKMVVKENDTLRAVVSSEQFQQDPMQHISNYYGKLYEQGGSETF